MHGIPRILLFPWFSGRIQRQDSVASVMPFYFLSSSGAPSSLPPSLPPVAILPKIAAAGHTFAEVKESAMTMRTRTRSAIMTLLLLAPARPGVCEEDPLRPLFELTPANWKEATEEKILFIRFQAPWCGHCKRMHRAWESLMKEYAGSGTKVIADVDCAGAGRPLCETHEVRGFPTLTVGSTRKRRSKCAL